MPSKIEITITTECTSDCTVGTCRCETIAENTHHFVNTLHNPGLMVTLQRLLEAERLWSKLIFETGKKKVS